MIDKVIILICLITLTISVAAIEISDAFLISAGVSMIAMYFIAKKNGYAD